MARGRSSFIMGTVEMLILFLLDKRDMYGYEIATLIRQLSEEDIVISESTLYPTLYKLIDKQLISDNPVRTGRRRVRVYYHLEDAGRARLADLLEDYQKATDGIQRILACKEIEEIDTNEQ